jgi:hypothetical protein
MQRQKLVDENAAALACNADMDDLTWNLPD